MNLQLQQLSNQVKLPQQPFQQGGKGVRFTVKSKVILRRLQKT